MEYIKLKKSDLSIPRVGFGCCPMGRHGWGVVDRKELVDAVHAALANEVNFFDTSDVYGLGESEATLGEALQGRRSEAIIATKFGVRRYPTGTTYMDNSPQWITKALEGSLRRLNTDYIDLYQIHYWDGKTPFSKIFQVLERLRKDGKIRYYGITNISRSQLGDIAVPDGLVSFSFEYSIARRESEKRISEFIADDELGFFSWGSLGQGILSGKYDNRAQFGKDDRRARDVYVNFHGKELERNLKILSGMRAILNGYPGRSLSQLAIRWILDRIYFSAALVGIKNVAQVLNLRGAVEWHLRKHDLQVIDSLSGGGNE